VARKRTPPFRRGASYNTVLADVAALIDTARRGAARSVNVIMTATYWSIGQRIVEQEQHGARRAAYGEELIERLAADLSRRFGRGFGRRNLFQMRSFYLAYREKVQTLSAQSTGHHGRRKVQTLSALSPWSLTDLTTALPLPWSHYVRLLSVSNPHAQAFYEGEALRGGWTIRQLERQIGTQFYERTALSRNKAAMLQKGARARTEDAVTPEEEVKDPFIFEFLNIKDEYSETELEEALILKL
jgi:hypothetical protein